ncbi:hypothetical protein R3P38DRAFT_2578598, partial [Favolaschia claudopus]
DFPYFCPPGAKRAIIEQWQDEMDPPKWIPAPCSVCGRLTAKTQLFAENPLDYDLTLLQNPCLPAETLPTNYNFKYDGAILCAAGLHDRFHKGIMDMCDQCRSVLKKEQQPLDALANFSITYAMHELPTAVRDAFACASMYDLQMVSRSRCTRITHLFCEKPTKSQILLRMTGTVKPLRDTVTAM